MPIRHLCLALLLCLTTIFTGNSFAQTVPRSSHVWVIAEENHSYEDIVGNPQMPFYNQLIHQYGVATQFYADQHSSLPALMWFVAGAPVEPNNDTVSCQHDEDNVVRELLKKGYDWRSYQETLPYAGFQGLYGGEGSAYYRRHNPLIDFKDVCPGTGQDKNSAPLYQMQTDFQNDKTPNFAYITPNVDEDAHNGTLKEADQWLQSNVPDILARPEFSPGGDGILFVVWDEGNLSTDNRCSATVSHGCGGRTATLVIGPRVKAGYESTVTYHNENVLKTVCAAMGLSPCPGAAQDAEPMADFFRSGGSTVAPSENIVISTPGDGATIAGAVRLVATASENQPISQTQVWDNHVKLGVYGDKIDATYKLAPGKHTTSVLDLNSDFKVIHEASVTYTVEKLVDGVQIISPTPNETFDMSTVHVVAQATESTTVRRMEVWDNGVKLGWYAGTQVNQYFNLAAGSHTVSVLDLDSDNKVLHKSSVTYSVK